MLNINNLNLFFSFYHWHLQKSNLNSLPLPPHTSFFNPLKADCSLHCCSHHSAETSLLGSLDESLDSPQKWKSLTSAASDIFCHSINPQTFFSLDFLYCIFSLSLKIIGFNSYSSLFALFPLPSPSCPILSILWNCLLHKFLPFHPSLPHYFQPRLPHAWSSTIASQPLSLSLFSFWSLLACWNMVHSVLSHQNSLHK